MINNTLYVAGLAPEVTTEELKKLFAETGKIMRADIITNYVTGESKGFGFVDMETREEAYKAMHALHGSFLRGNRIVVHT